VLGYTIRRRMRKVRAGALVHYEQTVKGLAAPPSGLKARQGCSEISVIRSVVSLRSEQGPPAPSLTVCS